MLAQFQPAILEAVHRASKRSSAIMHEEMRDGLHDLATIASIAPWIGIFGTILGIVNSFQGLAGRAAVCAGLARAMSFTALGLLVGLLALWSYEYLAGKLRSFDLEMENASLELLNQLGRFLSAFAAEPAIEPDSRPMFREVPPEDVHREERFYRSCLILAGVALALDWFVQAARSSAIVYPCFYVPITFVISCVFVYPFCSKFLHRRPGALVASGSVLCLCWSIAELLLSRPLP